MIVGIPESVVRNRSDQDDDQNKRDQVSDFHGDHPRFALTACIRNAVVTVSARPRVDGVRA